MGRARQPVIKALKKASWEYEVFGDNGNSYYAYLHPKNGWEVYQKISQSAAKRPHWRRVDAESFLAKRIIGLVISEELGMTA